MLLFLDLFLTLSLMERIVAARLNSPLRWCSRRRNRSSRAIDSRISCLAASEKWNDAATWSARYDGSSAFIFSTFHNSGEYIGSSCVISRTMAMTSLARSAMLRLTKGSGSMALAITWRYGSVEVTRAIDARRRPSSVTTLVPPTPSRMSRATANTPT